MVEHKRREHWGTRLGVILAVMGSAVGLGNFLRFPGLAASYEGGAFMIPYFIALFLLGLPLAWAEWAMGRYGGSRGYNSTPGIYRSIWPSKAAPYFGVLGMIVPVCIYMYYVLIESWCLGYAWFYLTGAMRQVGYAARAAGVEGQISQTPYKEFLFGFIGAAEDGSAFKGVGLYFLAACFVLNFVLIYRGLTRGIERFCLVAMPALLLCAVIVLIRVLTLPEFEGRTVQEGLAFMWEPVAKVEHAAAGDKRLPALIAGYGASITPTQVARGQWRVEDAARFASAASEAGWRDDDGDGVHVNPQSKLTLRLSPEGVVGLEHRGFIASLMNPKMWLDATGQIFFSLSVGFGIIITYASYLRRNDDVALSSLTSCAGNEFCEVALGGLITIPAAFIFLGAATVTGALGSSFGLGFLTLPMVFEQMPLGYVAGFLFFFLLFLAAVTSSLSMLQPAIALLEEALGVNRRASVSILGFVTLAGAMFILYFSKGTVALDTFDNWVGTLCIYLLAMFQTILFGWVLGVKRGMAEIDQGAEIRVPRVVGFVLKYIAPVYLGAIFVAFIVGEVQKGRDSYFAKVASDSVVAMSVGFIVLVIIFFTLIIGQGVARWRARDAHMETLE